MAIPLGPASKVIPVFGSRVANLLAMFGVERSLIESELEAVTEIQIASTANRRVLGCLNEIGYVLQSLAEDHDGLQPLSLSDAELEISDMVHGPLGARSPRAVAEELLAVGSGRAT